VTASWDTVRRRAEEDAVGDDGAWLVQETCRREKDVVVGAAGGFRRVGC